MKKANKQAISLIVLVITIIIMIVLAGAIILTLNNSGIINKAGEAVRQTNEATVKEVASLGWAEAYADGARTAEELREGVEAALEKNNIDTEDYGMIVTTSGVTIKKGWLKDGFKVIKGDQMLEIGDIVNYDAGVSTYTEGWKVLGADSDGNLLIVSAGNLVDFFELGDVDGANIAEAKNDFVTGISQLNSFCEEYGYGEGVVGKARSITAEDVNSVTGYDPTTYGKGTVSQYGNVVTYSYNGTTKPTYSSITKSGTLGTAHSDGFYYYNGEEVLLINDLLTGTSGEVFATLTSTYYEYDATNLTTINKETNAKAYSMLFGENLGDAGNYWLATQSVDSRALYGIFFVFESYVSGSWFFASYGQVNILSGYGVRAVVTLSQELKFTGNSTDGWSY